MVFKRQVLKCSKQNSWFRKLLEESFVAVNVNQWFWKNKQTNRWEKNKQKNPNPVSSNLIKPYFDLFKLTHLAYIYSKWL